MQQIKNGYISTSAIAKVFQVERDFLFSYLNSINLLFKNIATNSYELTEQGYKKGGKYQSSVSKAQWIIWPEEIVNSEIFNNINQGSVEHVNQSVSQVTINIWKISILKKLKQLIDKGKNIDEISLILNIDKVNVIKKINSLPRVKKKYYSMHQNDLINKEKDTLLTNEEIISYLAEGINPTTGELLSSDCFLNTPEIIRALFAAKEAILQKNIKIEKSRREKKTVEEKQNENIAKGLPMNAGLAWTEDIKKELADKYKENKSVSLLAEVFKRTKGSIVAELIKQKLITPEERYLHT